MQTQYPARLFDWAHSNCSSKTICFLCLVHKLACLAVAAHVSVFLKPLCDLLSSNYHIFGNWLSHHWWLSRNSTSKFLVEFGFHVLLLQFFFPQLVPHPWPLSFRLPTTGRSLFSRFHLKLHYTRQKADAHAGRTAAVPCQHSCYCISLSFSLAAPLLVTIAPPTNSCGKPCRRAIAANHAAQWLGLGKEVPKCPNKIQACRLHHLELSWYI